MASTARAIRWRELYGGVERNELVNPGKDGARRWAVDFLVKYVRHDKQDGIYLPEISGKKSVWNWR